MTEQNRIIAEFMGWVLLAVDIDLGANKYSSSTWDCKEVWCLNPRPTWRDWDKRWYGPGFPSEKPFDEMIAKDKLTYHDSWNRLMPVVQKTKELADEELLQEWSISIDDAILTLDLQTIYKEVVEFIKFYERYKEETQ